jgi:hypothetical protein
MSTTENSPDSTETQQIFPAGSVEAECLRQYVSYCEAVQTEFRVSVLPEYPSLAKHLLISMFLAEKRQVACLIRNKAYAMADGDKSSMFYGSGMYWDDAISCIDWLISQLNHAKPR